MPVVASRNQVILSRRYGRESTTLRSGEFGAGDVDQDAFVRLEHHKGQADLARSVLAGRGNDLTGARIRQHELMFVTGEIESDQEALSWSFARVDKAFLGQTIDCCIGAD